MKFKLGSLATDRITGFRGIVVARSEHIDGTLQYCLQPGIKPDGDFRKHEWFAGCNLIGDIQVTGFELEEKTEGK